MVYVVRDVGVAAAAVRHDIKSQNIWHRAVVCVCVCECLNCLQIVKYCLLLFWGGSLTDSCDYILPSGSVVLNNMNI